MRSGEEEEFLQRGVSMLHCKSDVEGKEEKAGREGKNTGEKEDKG